MNFLAKIDSKRIDAAGDVNITAGALSITADGSNEATLTESGSGDFEIHAADDLRLNADGHDIVLKGASNEFGRLANSSQNFIIKNITADKDIIFQADNGSGGLAEYLRMDGGITSMVASVDLLMGTDGDGGKIKFGASQDLQIYHDGSNSYIDEVGTGSLYVRASDTVYIQKSDGSSAMAQFTAGGGSFLYHNNSLKFGTTSSGVEVTGKVVTTEIESASTILLDAAADITIDAGGQDIILSQDATIFGTISNSSGLQIRSRVNDADMFLRGVDGGVEFNALQLDMSSQGDAYFNNNIALNGKMVFNNNQELRWQDSSGTERTVLELDSSNNLYLGTSAGGNLYLVNGSSYTTAVTIDSSQNATFAGDIDGDKITLTQNAYSDGYRLVRSGHDTYRIALGDSEGLQIINETDSGRKELRFDGEGNALFAGKVQFESTSDYIDVISSDLYIIAAQKNILYSGNLETLRLETTGQVEFDKYGAQTFTGTSASYLIATSSGDIIEKTPAQVRSDIGAGTGSGSVTSVAVTVGTGLDVSGSPITSSGTIDIDLDLTEITVGAGLDTTATGISLDLSELSSATGAMGSSDNFVLSTSGGNNRKCTPNLIGLSLFNNDAGFTTNSGTVTGSGSANQIAYWSGSSAIGGESGLTYNTTQNKLIFSGDYAMRDNSGVFELNTDTSDVTTTIKGFGGSGSLTVGENTVYTAASGFYVPSGYGISAGTTATASGTIRATGNIVAYYSDEKLKDFEGTIPNALDKVCKLNGYYYTQNEKAAELGYENYERQVGVSAQEVEKVMPEVVETAPISYNNDEDYLTVDYGRLVPLLIESIKELKNEIEILKNKSCGN